MNATHQPATAAGTFRLGGDLPITRLGLGTMQMTGPGVWGTRKTRTEPSESCAALSSSA